MYRGIFNGEVPAVNPITFLVYIQCKKSLKILKRYSESVNRRTDNTRAKRKSIKGQKLIYKTYTLN
jgi:hypothetical protein